MVAHVKLATPDPQRGRKPAPRVRATVGHMLSPELQKAKDALKRSGLDTPDFLESM